MAFFSSLDVEVLSSFRGCHRNQPQAEKAAAGAHAKSTFVLLGKQIQGIRDPNRDVEKERGCSRETKLLSSSTQGHNHTAPARLTEWLTNALLQWH